jgi:hypothetical protein
MQLTLTPCDYAPASYFDKNVNVTTMVNFAGWEPILEPAERGIVNGELFVPPRYYSLRSTTPNDRCINMMGWNRDMPFIQPRHDTCERSLKNSVMHFNFPVIIAPQPPGS